MRNWQIWLAGFGLVVVTSGVRAQNVPARGNQVDFQRDIKPIFTNSCISCHGPNKAKGRLRLDTASATLQGGSSGPAVVPGKSASSLLAQVVAGRSQGVERMPPKGPGLSANQVALLKAWIDQGAKAPANEPVVASKPSKGNAGEAPSKGKSRDRGRRRRGREKGDD